MSLEDIAQKLSEFSPILEDGGYIISRGNNTFYINPGSFQLRIRNPGMAQIVLRNVGEVYPENELVLALRDYILRDDSERPKNISEKKRSLNLEADEVRFCYFVEYSPKQEQKVVELISGYLKNPILRY